MEKYAPNSPPITAEVAAAGVVSVLNGATIKDTGSFFNYDGSKHAW